MRHSVRPARARLVAWGARVLFAATLMALAVAPAGCIPLQGEEPPDWLNVQPETSETIQTESEPTEAPAPGDAHGHGTEVLMMGRSVMEGWFEHWGWDGERPVIRDGYALYYRSLPSPPEIGSAAAAEIAKVPDGTVVFFKLCFEDFYADSETDIEPALAEAVGYARQAVEAASGRDVTLVLGNALPRVRSQTSAALVGLHERYNASLEQLAADHANVAVFDQYSVLAGHDGSLSRGLALTPDDSHLNDVAYQALDAEFFPLLTSLE